jgi:hypothetical protein
LGSLQLRHQLPAGQFESKRYDFRSDECYNFRSDERHNGERYDGISGHNCRSGYNCSSGHDCSSGYNCRSGERSLAR